MRTRNIITGSITAAALSAALILGGAPASASADQDAAASGAFTVDAVHSGVLFRITHMGASAFHGRFNEVSGTYELSADKPEAGKIDITIQAQSVDTANDKRDQHLRSPDFFNAKQFPTITFKSTSIAKAGDKTVDITGDLTLLGVTKSVKAKGTVFNEVKAPQGAKSGFEALFTIKRSEFGMSKYIENGALSDEVAITVFIEGDRN